MTLSHRWNRAIACLAGMLLLGASVGRVPIWAEGVPAGTPTSAPSRSEITSVRAVAGTLQVSVRVPAGRRRVTLETRSQVHRGAWTPRRVEVLDSLNAAEQRFEIPLGNGSETVRIREETEDELGLPLGFFLGTNTFAPQLQPTTIASTGSGTGNTVLVPGAVSPILDSKVGLATTGTGNFSAGSALTVVESDIWKLEGNTLYFFNQQRGLQVIDVTQPDHPVLTGTLPLAVWGEDLYRLPASAAGADGSAWLALLTQQDCNGLESQVLLVQVKDGKPVLRGTLPAAGQIRESRLVGDSLVVAGADWFSPPPVPILDTNGVVIGSQSANWEARTTLSSFELSNPAKPVVQTPLTLPVSPNAVLATDQFLFVATTGTRQPSPTERPAAWAVAGNHAIMAFDISQPGRQPVQAGFVMTAGLVSDKFRIGFDGETLAAVSQTDSGSYVQLPVDKGGGTNWTWQWAPSDTVLETYSFANPLAPTALGKLTLVSGEQVYAARFSGSRAYVVTYRQVDPLWIVDLSRPADPVIRGHLSIPGYSTFLQPMADDTRLLALGYDGSRTRLQMFDVTNPAKPGLMSETTLGTGWSWSEANSNEKAFTVFPEVGLALLPWQGQRFQDGNLVWFQGTQLIDFDLAAGTVKARGTIESLSQARRASWVRDRILALSPTELTTVEATNRDQPRVVNRLPLSSEVDRVLVAGDSLLLIDASNNPRPQIRLVKSAAPDAVVASLDLDPLPVKGAVVRGDILHLFQASGDTWKVVTRQVTNEEVSIIQLPPIPTLVTNRVTKRIPPAIIKITSTQIFIREESIAGLGVVSVTTNEVPVVEVIPQPMATNWITTNWTVDFPPVPGEVETRSMTTTWIHPEYVPLPDVVTEYDVVETVYFARPPVRLTNMVSTLIADSFPVPGQAQIATVRVGNNGLTRLATRSIPRVTNDTPFNAPPMIGLWVSPDVLVWTERNEGGYYFGGPVYALDLGVKAASLASPMMTPSLLPYVFYQPAHFYAVRVADPANPEWMSQSKVKNSAADGQYWSGASGAFAADGKVFLTHQTTLSSPPTQTYTVVTNKDGTLEKHSIYEPGVFEVRHFLDVVDFADPSMPTFRDPVAVPGTLAGVSHAGQLLYFRGPLPGEAKDPTQYLQAAAYDGTAVSLVASLALPDQWPSTQWIGDNGTVWLARPSSTANTPSSLETWSLGAAGKFEPRGTTAVSEPISEFRLLDGLLMAASAGHVLLLDPAWPAGSKPVLSASKSCALWYDSAHAAASRTDGLWLSRGSFGLWQIAPSP